MKSTKTLNAIKTSSGEGSLTGYKWIWAAKTIKKQNLRGKNLKNGIFSNFSRGRRQPVRTGAYPLCAHSNSASRDALCNTQRLRPTVKIKKN